MLNPRGSFEKTHWVLKNLKKTTDNFRRQMQLSRRSPCLIINRDYVLTNLGPWLII